MIIMNQDRARARQWCWSLGRLPCILGQKSKDSQGLVLSYHLPLSLHK
jgi:hypothetical protein